MMRLIAGLTVVVTPRGRRTALPVARGIGFRSPGRYAPGRRSVPSRRLPNRRSSWRVPSAKARGARRHLDL